MRTAALSTVWTLLLLAAAPLALAQTEPAIGVVLAVRGQVQARADDGSERALARRSSVFQGDTILVGSEASVQLKLVDDALLALRADTEFTFDSYVFDGDSATPDEALMSMLRGGFRTISGSIGDADQDEYRLDTPMASMGIRGTVYEGLIVGTVLYTAVYEGGTTVSNNFGSIDTGIGANFDFAETRQGEPPVGLLEQPRPLAAMNLVVAALTAEEGEADGEAAETAAVAPAAAGTAPAPEGGNTQLAAISAVSEVRNAAGDNPGTSVRSVATTLTGQEIDIRSQGNLTSSSNSSGQSLVSLNTADGTQGVNPVLNTRAASELASADNRGGVQGNSGNGNGNGNGNSNAGGNSSNSGSGNSNAGGNSGSSSGNSGSTSNGNSGSSSGNSGSTSNGNSGSSSGKSGSTSNGNSGSSSGNSGSTSNGNSGSSSGNSGSTSNGNSGSSSGNSGSTSNGSSGSNSGNGNSSGSNGNSGSGSTQTTTTTTQTASTSSFSSLSALTAAPSPALPSDFMSMGSLGSWAGLNPVDLLDMSGRVSYSSSDFRGVDGSGAALQSVAMSFVVDMVGGNGAISDGKLSIIDGSNNPWETSFDGDLAGSAATFTNVAGRFGQGVGQLDIGGSISGGFVGSPAMPAFVTGFDLTAGAQQVQGQVLLGQ